MENRIHSAETPENPTEEAYNVLRANIQFSETGRKLHTLAVTSYSAGEGKTTTSLKLAAAMAKTGLRVLFVDADLRKQKLKNQESRGIKGLSHFLAGSASFQEVINYTKTKGMYFAASGGKPLNPAELLGSGRLGEFLDIAAEKFDVVIIDTPPLGYVIDGAVIAARTDGTLIVIEPDKVRYQNALMVKEQLEKAKAQILGVVLNKVEKNDYRGYYSEYDYYKSGKFKG